MRQVLTLLAIATGCVGLACAESFSGTLLDASCATAQQQSQNQQNQTSMQSCAPTSSTTSFALQTSSGKIYQLDSTGNSKAADAMKSRADRSANGAGSGSTTATSVTATVTGKREGDTITVESINVQ